MIETVDMTTPAAMMLDAPRTRSLRLQVYGFLATAFAGDLETLPDQAVIAAEAFNELPSDERLEAPGPGGPGDLEAEYVRLFLNTRPGAAGALPYGSLYLEDGASLLMGGWAEQVERLLQEEGLRVPSGGILVPDHATVACEYLSHLIGSGLDSAVRKDRRATGILLAKELSFLSGGFVAFMHGLHRAIEAADAPGIFRFAGELAAARSRLDRQLLLEVHPHASEER
jgi:TorA maturation chaperone TorD